MGRLWQRVWKELGGGIRPASLKKNCGWNQIIGSARPFLALLCWTVYGVVPIWKAFLVPAGQEGSVCFSILAKIRVGERTFCTVVILVVPCFAGLGVRCFQWHARVDYLAHGSLARLIFVGNLNWRRAFFKNGECEKFVWFVWAIRKTIHWIEEMCTIRLWAPVKFFVFE